MKLTPRELKEILRLHKLWLEGKPEGKRADLRGADLRYNNLSGVDLREADMRGANLSGVDLREADMRGAKFDNVPVVENLDAKILAAISNGKPRLGKCDKPSLHMATWHTCETTHCRAGWAIVLAGKEGAELEMRFGSQVAGTLIYQASTGRVPDFYATNEDALADIQRAAGVGAEQAEERP